MRNQHIVFYAGVFLACLKGLFHNYFDWATFDLQVMALIADFMLVWLPAPTVALRSISKGAGPIAKFFYGCPDNAFQVKADSIY